MAGAGSTARYARVRSGYGELQKRWPQFQMVVDACIWLGSVPLATLLRFDFELSGPDWRRTAWCAAATAVGFLTLGFIVGMYRRRYRYGSFDEIATLAIVALATSVALFAVQFAFEERLVPASVPVIAGLLALVALAGARYVGRRLLELLSRPDPSATPVLIYGAGDAGSQLVASMQRNPNGAYRPVGLIDDHFSKANLTIRGVRVLGTGADLVRIASETGAAMVVIAIPSADGPVIRELVARTTSAGLQPRTLPSLAELDHPNIEASDIRKVTEADLLGRRQIDTDLTAIGGYITGKRVLVTGAGGSIGSELCRQLSRFAPESLIMLERDESALHGVQLSIEGRALLDTPNLVVADIRDADRLHEVFELHRPHVVFHAAALKHLPLLEMHVEEGVKTNIWGTQNVLDAAVAHGVERFVNISTDKAANPESVLGFTKRIAERLTAHVADETGLPYLSVRFGNVLGSRGSVVPAFQAMIDAGGPVTVTHPDVTRYFMTIPEAVQLVIQAGAIGSPGEVLVLDMGQPVRIADVARRLIEASGKAVDIVYTGLRPGEKMHEDLVALNELCMQRSHPLISHTAVEPLSAERVADDLASHLRVDSTALARTSALAEPALRVP